MAEADKVRGAARKTADVMLSSWGYVDEPRVVVENLAGDALQAAIDAGVVVLADDAAAREREAQERALLDAADAIELPSLDDYANTPTDAEAAAKAWLCRRARIYADPPAPHGDAEGYVCEVCGCWNATGQPCKYEDEHPREDETHG